jgi:hypothetical protein
VGVRGWVVIPFREILQHGGKPSQPTERDPGLLYYVACLAAAAILGAFL